MKPIEIHQQLSETCSDGVMDVKNVHSWVRLFTEGRTSCETNRKSLRHALADLARVVHMIMEDRRLTVRQIAANASISVGSMDTILHDDLKLWKVSARWVSHGGCSFGLFSHDVPPSVNCHTHDRTFFTSITPSLHASLSC
jgi:hypothetical protein